MSVKLHKFRKNIAAIAAAGRDAAYAVATSPLKRSNAAFLAMNGLLFQAGAMGNNEAVIVASVLGISGNLLGIALASGKATVNEAVSKSRQLLTACGERASFGCFLGSNIAMVGSGIFMHAGHTNVSELMVGAMSMTGNLAALLPAHKVDSSLANAGRALLQGRFRDAAADIAATPRYRITRLFYWGSVGSTAMAGMTQGNPWFMGAGACAAFATYQIGRATRAELPSADILILKP